MQFLEMANLSRQKADEWLPQRWKQRSSKSGGCSVGGKQADTARLGDGRTTLQTDFTNMTFILAVRRFYYMQTIPKETVLKGVEPRGGKIPCVSYTRHLKSKPNVEITVVPILLHTLILLCWVFLFLTWSDLLSFHPWKTSYLFKQYCPN